MTTKIDAAEFRKRLEALCARGTGREWPRKTPDQHVLLKSAAMLLKAGRDYSETEINEPLDAWCQGPGEAIIMDHVTLRRHLVDAGYLTRDAAGHSYRLDAQTTAEMFAPEIAALDPAAIVRDALREREERKRAFMKKG